MGIECYIEGSKNVWGKCFRFRWVCGCFIFVVIMFLLEELDLRKVMFIIVDREIRFVVKS